MSKKYTTQTFKEKLKSLNSDIEIIDEYIDCYTKIRFRCKKHNEIYSQMPVDVTRGRCGCEQCRVEKIRKARLLDPIDFQRRLDNLNPNIILLTEYQSMHTKVRCKCKIDGYEWDVLPTNLIDKGSGCPICNKTKVVSGYNDIATTHPHYLKIIKDINYAKSNSVHSHNKTLFVCPDCGNSFTSTMSNVHYQGLSCPSCSDGFSYPNKVMYNILKQCNIDFIREFSCNWTNGRRYDFCIPSAKVLIEMDGGLGHGRKSFKDGNTSEESLAIDRFKDSVAKENGYSVIRIDCLYSDINYIKQNVLSSTLPKFVCLEHIDWDTIDIQSRRSYILKIADLVNDGSSLDDITVELKIHKKTVEKYYTLAVKYGLCDNAITKETLK